MHLFRDKIDVEAMDFSALATAEMRVKGRGFFSLRFTERDARTLKDDYGASAFDVVIDKGFLDGFLAKGDGPDAISVDTEIQKFLPAVIEILKPGGCYVLVSLLQPYIAHALTKCLLTLALRQSTVADPVRIIPLEVRDSGALQPFLVIISKTEGQTQLPSVLVEPQQAGDMKQEFQLGQLAAAAETISRERRLNSFVLSHRPGQTHTIELRDTKDRNLVRYIVTLFDATSRSEDTAAILVPFGMEHSWLMTSEEGNEQLANRIGCRRLLLLRFGPSVDNSCFTGLTAEQIFNEIKLEVSGCLQRLALGKKNKPINVLSIREHLGEKKIIATVESEFAHKILVYDFKEEKKTRRVLAFECNPSLTQSEVFIDPDGNYILEDSCTGYYSAIIASVGFLACLERPRMEFLRVCVIGIGGGILPNLLLRFVAPAFKQMKLDAVDLDSDVVKVAQNYFGYPRKNETENWNLDTHIMDGSDFIAQIPEADLHHMIIIDVNSPNCNDVIQCPPPAFINEQFWKIAASKLHEHGIFLLNFVTRSSEARRNILQNFKNAFASAYEIAMEEDINKVLIGLKSHAPENFQLSWALSMLSTRTNSPSWVPNTENASWNDRVTKL